MLFTNLKTVFGSRMKALEILMLLNDKKKVVRHLFTNTQLENVKEFCVSHGLCLNESTFKVVLLDLEKKFSNKGTIVNREDSREGMIAVYISKDEINSLQAKYYELVEDHKNLGLLLGYPECCIEFFNRENPIRKRLDNDYAISALHNSSGLVFPFYTNYFLREKDFFLISHFPCNYNCEKSVLLGKKSLEVLKKVDLAESELVKANLKTKIFIDGKTVEFV